MSGLYPRIVGKIDHHGKPVVEVEGGISTRLEIATRIAGSLVEGDPEGERYWQLHGITNDVLRLDRLTRHSFAIADHFIRYDKENPPEA